MSALTISNPNCIDAACVFSVDLTSSASISRSCTNPVIVIPVPTGDDAASYAGAIAFNLKMMTHRIEIKFTLTTGVGSNSWTPTSGSTDYEKLWYMMMRDAKHKVLTWEGQSYSCQMDSLTTPTAGGSYNTITGYG